MSKSRSTQCHINSNKVAGDNYKCFCKAAHNYIVNCLKFRGLNIDKTTTAELVDECVVVALRYFVDNYDPVRSAKVSTFIYSCCKLASRNIVDRFHRFKDREITIKDSLSMRRSKGFGEVGEPGIQALAGGKPDTSMRQVDAKDMVDKIYHMFRNDPRMLRLLDCKKDGLSFKDITTKFGSGVARQSYGQEWTRKIRQVRYYFEKIKGLSAQDILGKPYPKQKTIFNR